MKYLLLACLFFLLVNTSCKKDSGIVEPAEVQDFSGWYDFTGTLEIQSNPVEAIPLHWVVTAEDQGKYRVGEAGLQSWSTQNAEYRLATSGIYSGLSGLGRFQLLVFGGKFQSVSLGGPFWTVEELNDLFQPGRQLIFGMDYGQVLIEVENMTHPSGEYWSLWADNSANRVTIESVNDLEGYFPDRKWVKQVVLRFDVYLTRSYPNSGMPDILLKNCRTSLLFEPGVE